MERIEPSRRNFLQATAGGLIVSASLTSADTNAAEAGPAVRVANPLSGDVLRTRAELSPDAQVLREQPREVPVVGKSDVLVCGGGPAGIAAALAAARAGATVQLIEVAGCLGGVWTAGLLTKILDSENKSGIMAELLRAFSERGSAIANQTNGTVYDPEVAKLVLEERCLQAGVKIRLHTRLVGAVTDSHRRVIAVLTESKSGREAWLAERFVDCSGDGDLAAHAGCRFDLGVGEACECQPMSMMALLTGLDADKVRPYIRETASSAKSLLLSLMEQHGMSPSYRGPTLRHLHSDIFSIMTNHEYGVSAFDANAISEATIRARREVHDLVSGLRHIGGPWKNISIVATAEQIGVREGRRIRGRYQITADDLAAGLKHEQAVCTAKFPIDVHALNTHGNKEISREFKQGGHQPYDIPYPALIAADVDGLLLAGRCISGDFVAHSSYRVTGNSVPMGEAAGRAAAVSIQRLVMPHELRWSEIRSSG
ncbi:FAD-dependent oxidoreductase [Allorhodopirellula heiligendammensis]|uniref:Ribulose-1,5-biphosphate synthetase n=1 Tax=Allorhodopirellula heiligendammensis TaxID=2714739 RepID=A0A5C6C2R2_9BACT|nr:FAD-dependent oxidoreductase [Allorhodopirellula heiligendammensis]TWU18773.1 ribulose-1,5-biphosphate synthetase [Allorhodopirellula heiligendammensis]